jgi:hypothetical protein
VKPFFNWFKGITEMSVHDDPYVRLMCEEVRTATYPREVGQAVNVERSQPDAKRSSEVGQNKMENAPPRILSEGRITFEAYMKTHFPQDGGRAEWEWNHLPDRVKGNWASIEQAVIDAYEGNPSRTAVLPIRTPRDAA